MAALLQRLRGAPAAVPPPAAGARAAHPLPSWSWGGSAAGRGLSFADDPEASVHYVFASLGNGDADGAPEQGARGTDARSAGASLGGRSGSRRSGFERSPRERLASENVQSAIADRNRALASKLAHRARGLTRLARKPAAAQPAAPTRCLHASCAHAFSLGPWPATARGVQAWRAALVLLALWSALEAPYRLAFGSPEGTTPLSRRLECGALAVDLFFCLDMVLRAACVLPLGAPPGTTRGALAARYLRSARLPLDLVSSLPLDMIAAAAGGDHQAQFALGSLRLLRLLRVSSAFSEAEADVSLSYLWVRVSKLAFILLLQCHVFACVFFFIAVSERRFQDTWLPVHGAAKPGGAPTTPLRRYLFALYYSTTTLASVGYGDVSPTSDPEYLAAIVFMISNVGLFAYVTGHITVLATTSQKSTRVYRKAYGDLEAFMRANQLPDDVRAEMRSYMLLRFNAAEDHPEVLESFPPVLRARVARLLHLPVLSATPLLADCGHGFVDALACQLAVELFMPGVAVLSQFDMSHELFFLASGAAQVLARDELAQDAQDGDADSADLDDEDCLVCLETIGEGASFGEAPFLFHLPQPFTVRTSTLCRVLCLKREAWASAEAAHPRDARIAERAVLAALQAATAAAGGNGCGPLRRSILMPLVEGVTAAMAARDAERVGELCLAAGRNDVLSLRRALAAGAAPSTADYDGRTALHVAAAKGADAAVRYLVDHGASLNAVDAFGNTPLFEAVVCGHATAAAMLRAAGAVLGLREAHAGPGHTAAAADTSASAAAAVRRGLDAGTIMCQVASSGDVSFLSALLANGLPARAADYDGRTGLHLAAALGRTQVVALLLGTGADPSARDNFGRTPLLEAVRAEQEACIALLLRRGAALGLRDHAAGAAPGDILAGGELCQAAFRGDLEYLRRLLRAGAAPDAADYDARTAAHLACAQGALHVAMALHAAGADFTRRDRWGHTPLAEAAQHGHTELAELLRKMPRLQQRRASSSGAAVPGDAVAARVSASAAAAACGVYDGGAAAETMPTCGSVDEDADDAASLPGSAGSMLFAWPPPARRQAGEEEGHVEGLPAPRERSVAQPEDEQRGSASERSKQHAAGLGSWLAALEPAPAPASDPAQ